MDTSIKRSSSLDDVTIPPKKLLQQEVDALNACLKDILLASTRVYKFYVEVQKLGLSTHVPNPPQALTAALGREVEKYDQICDLIEVQLNRAIENLKYELRQEEEKIAAEERKKQLAAAMLPPPVPDPGASTGEENDVKSSPVQSVTNTPVARRPSAISISSLQRPQLPFKLDLSSAAFRLSEEEASLYAKGLASPATLAPRSARPLGPGEFPPELMAAFAGTPLATTMPPGANFHTMPPSMPPAPGTAGLGIMGLGESSDKPIELDLESMEIDVQNILSTASAGSSGPTGAHDNLFPSVTMEGSAGSSQEHNQGNADTGAFDGSTDELFGDFDSGSEPSQSLLPADDAAAADALLAQMDSGISTGQPSGSNTAAAQGQSGAEHFDLTNMDFFAGGQDAADMNLMDMDLFMGVGQGDSGNQGNPPTNTTNITNPPTS